MELVIPNLRDGYIDLVTHVLEHGEPVAPRGIGTLEVRGSHVVLEDPTDALPLGVGRGVNTAIGAYEAASLIAGVSVPDLILKIAPGFATFMNRGQLLGAYGPRLRRQLVRVIETLKHDPDSRQAVATIWLPDDPTPGSRDVPCTVNLQWMIRDGKLEAFTTMRSNDVWLGVAYDYFQFTQLQLSLCHVLGLEPGLYHHEARSLHLYEEHIEATTQLHSPTNGPASAHGFTGSSWDVVVRKAQAALTGHPVPFNDKEEEPYPDHWYGRVLGRYLT